MFESEVHTEQGSPSLVGRGIANPQELPSCSFAADFESYLKTQKKRNARQMLCYAQRYGDILKTGDSTRLVNIQSDAVRRHAMEALCIYSKYTGRYDRWQEMRKRYSLKWTNGNESLHSLQRFLTLT